MGWDSLATSLVELPSFHKAYDDLVVESVASQFPQLMRTVEAKSIDWHHLLLCGSVLSRSIDNAGEEAALRIAQSCLTNAKTTDEMKDAACVILDTLTNRPAIQLAISRQLIQDNFASRVPLPLRMDVVRRECEQTQYTYDGAPLHLNRFQMAFWNRVEDSDCLSVSAPTSTGKSFVICQWLLKRIATHPATTAVYVVPTRALISQVEKDLNRHFSDLGEVRVSVSSMPTLESMKPHSANVFVLTQERFHLLLNVLPDTIPLNVVIVDEAHKVGDGARGILLEQVIANAVRIHSSSKIVFASPQTANPEAVLTLASQSGSRKTDFHRSMLTTVNQNLIWASQVPYQRKTPKWHLELCQDGELRSLGHIELPFRPDAESKRLPFVAYALTGDDSGSLLYVNGAADAEKAARHLWQLAGESADDSDDPEVAAVIELVKKTIHADYYLATALERRIAFHYGNMPLLLREEIERLFVLGAIKYLICTSTLIEGVNLPCKTIFVRGPKKGMRNPMSPADFWNLAGRAGRLGKEFQGNIVCVDPLRNNVWSEPAPRRRSAYMIRRATRDTLSDIDEFIEFVEKGTPRDTARANPAQEQLYAYLATEMMRVGTLEKSTIADGVDAKVLARAEAAIRESLHGVEVPAELVQRNPGISPIAMQCLVEYFREFLDDPEKVDEELLPPLPESDEAVEIYNRVLQRVNTHLAKVFHKQTFRFSIVVVNWMRGHSLKRMIQADIRWHENKSRDYVIGSVIRDTMKNIEEVARFLAPKYVACYIDVLKWELFRQQKNELAESIPEIHLWLEFGASQTTQLSLMSLGLSRTSAIAVSELIVDDSLGEQAAFEWLKGYDLETTDLPRIVVSECRRLTGHPDAT